MSIILFAANKGGVAKSTTTATIGSILASIGARTLLVDTDPQGSLSHHLKADPTRGNLSDVIGITGPGEATIADVSQQVRENLFIVPTDETLALVLSGLVVRRNNERQLANALEPIKADYDYILIDSAPSLSIMLSNSLLAADHVVALTTLDTGSINGLTLLLSNLRDHQSDFGQDCATLLGTMAARVNLQTVLARDALETLQAREDLRLFDTHVRDRVSVREAAAVGLTVDLYSPDSDATQDYKQLTHELLKRIENG